MFLPCHPYIVSHSFVLKQAAKPQHKRLFDTILLVSSFTSLHPPYTHCFFDLSTHSIELHCGGLNIGTSWPYEAQKLEDRSVQIHKDVLFQAESISQVFYCHVNDFSGGLAIVLPLIFYFLPLHPLQPFKLSFPAFIIQPLVTLSHSFFLGLLLGCQYLSLLSSFGAQVSRSSFIVTLPIYIKYQ